MNPIIAYRIWKVSSEGRLSTAYRGNGKWPWMKPYLGWCDGGDRSFFTHVTPTGTAGKTYYDPPRPDHDAPHFDCACGLYGYKSVKCLEQTFHTYSKGDCVLGRVALWGKIVEHEDGYRAEYGYPQVLYNNDQQNTLVAAQKYGIDTAPLPEEVKDAYEKWVAQKRLGEEKTKQIREMRERMNVSSLDTLWNTFIVLDGMQKMDLINTSKWNYYIEEAARKFGLPNKGIK